MTDLRSSKLQAFGSASIPKLVLMFSGNRFADIDAADIMEVFKNGCRFNWSECGDDDFAERAKSLLGAGNSYNSEKKAVFMQVSDVNVLTIAQLEIPEEPEIFMQIIMTEEEPRCGRIALFYPER